VPRSTCLSPQAPTTAPRGNSAPQPPAPHTLAGGQSTHILWVDCPPLPGPHLPAEDAPHHAGQCAAGFCCQPVTSSPASILARAILHSGGLCSYGLPARAASPAPRIAPAPSCRSCAVPRRLVWSRPASRHPTRPCPAGQGRASQCSAVGRARRLGLELVLLSPSLAARLLFASEPGGKSCPRPPLARINGDGRGVALHRPCVTVPGPANSPLLPLKQLPCRSPALKKLPCQCWSPLPRNNGSNVTS
jgi:hypothetical protein